MNEVRKTGVASAIIIDGSYVTIKAEPNDIDIILVLRQDVGLAHEMMPDQYRIQSKRMARKEYGVDVLPCAPGTESY